MNSLTAIGPFNLDNLFEHISEFVRIDEHLRIKMLCLDNITPESPGWTYLAGKEITEHKRIINSVRCFLQYQARENWGQDIHMVSSPEYKRIKTHKDNNYEIYNLPAYDSISNDDQFWFLMTALNDKEATYAFYKTLIGKVYKTTNGKFISGIQKDQIISHILNKCVFSLP
jgi:hypothetical protein